MAGPSWSNHGDARTEVEDARGWAVSLRERMRIGEQTIRTPMLWVPGRYYSAELTCTTLGTQAATASRLYLVPFYTARPRAVDQIATNIGTAATGVVRMGIYNSDPDTGMPTTVLVDGGTGVSTNSTGAKPQTISATLDGLEWFALVTSGTATFTALPANESAAIAGGASASNAGANHIYSAASVDATAALPSLVGATFTYATANVPIVQVRAA